MEYEAGITGCAFWDDLIYECGAKENAWISTRVLKTLAFRRTESAVSNAAQNHPLDRSVLLFGANKVAGIGGQNDETNGALFYDGGTGLAENGSVYPWYK